MRHIFLFAVLSLLVWFTQGKQKSFWMTSNMLFIFLFIFRLQLAARVLRHVQLALLLSIRGHEEELPPGRALHGGSQVSQQGNGQVLIIDAFSYKGWVPNHGLKCLASKDKFIYQEQLTGGRG